MNYRYLASVLLMLLFVAPGSVPQTSKGISGSAPGSILERSRLSPDLDGFLQEEKDEIGLIVQYASEIRSGDLEFLGSLGFSVQRTFHIVPALSVLGPLDALSHLLENDRIIYVEHNDPVIPDMEMGTRVINATRVWSSVVRSVTGDEEPIDGTGVTVCVVDTGIDAGHPDLDYGKKTVINVFDAGGGTWLEGENTDTNYGHGTHVAGTVAGNGDASAGARRGVAPGANLIGITVSIPEEATSPTEDGYIQGLEWVYDHSRPGSNKHNIRVVTNSWHSTVTEYDPDSVLTKVIEKLSFENNVVSIWSAGNDGRDDPNGDDITTSGQGNTPVAIMVAAYERDGSAVTDFSSRGRIGDNHTYPDVGAPGRSIWSCSARRTVISGLSYVGGNRNPYYLAISGTSMSTPHVAGLVALLWQACPSMDISNMREDYSGDDTESWYSNPRTFIHDAEWILEASALFLPPTPDNGNVGGDTNSTGWWGKPIDYVQGYGIVDAHRAVGIALTLQELRDKYPQEYISVGDAIRSYDGYDVSGSHAERSSKALAEWSGEFSRYNDQSGNPLSLVNQTKFVAVPDGAARALVTLTFSAIDLTEFKAADLAFTIDLNGDGSVDHRSDLSLTGSGRDVAEIDVTGAGIWTFDIEGMGLRIPRPFVDPNYVELRIEYDMSVEFELEGDGNVNASARDALHAVLVPGYRAAGNHSVEVMHYDTSNVDLVREEIPRERKEKSFPWGLFMVVIAALVLAVAGYAYRKKRKGKGVDGE